MSLLIAWSFFHKLYEPDSPLASNFLLITPNIIVLDRLRADFDGLRIFFNDPILPDISVRSSSLCAIRLVILHPFHELLRPVIES